MPGTQQERPPVAFAVALVVLLVEGDQVCKCEAVVGGDEVDAVLWPSPATPLPSSVVPPPVTCITTPSASYSKPAFAAAQGKGYTPPRRAN